MTKLHTATFALAAAVAAVSLGGCNKDNPYENQTATHPEAKRNTGITAELIESGDFFDVLKDGAYKLTIPGKHFGRDQNVQCLLIKDGRGYRGYTGLSCDFDPPQ
ncbi:MAG: hypothetical protein LRZ85_00080 [Alphaproteobacteria bacterium]|nr:hypothetical protein [Alphaproteobacteria bacterium]MCD8526555.1 hypothetical protein [Alphaproteobacteria bacterium]MCD8571331.1 hypothetical protein [Alphaproteobacteria bacterium]